MDGKFDVTDAANKERSRVHPRYFRDRGHQAKSSRKIVIEFLEKLHAKRPLSEDEEEMKA
jgi:hypothetical protein